MGEGAIELFFGRRWLTTLGAMGHTPHLQLLSRTYYIYYISLKQTVYPFFTVICFLETSLQITCHQTSTNYSYPTDYITVKPFHVDQTSNHERESLHWKIIHTVNLGRSHNLLAPTRVSEDPKNIPLHHS